MAIPLSQIISGSVYIQSPPAGEVPFGIPLLFGYHASLPSSPLYYSPDTILSDLAALGVPTTDPSYIAAQAIIAQREYGPIPEEIGAVTRSANQAQVDTAVCPAVPDIAETYTVTINGTDFSSVNPADLATLIADLVAAVNGGAEPVTAAPASPNITLTADVAGTPFTATVSVNTPAMTIATTTPNVNGATQIATIWAADKKWYCLLPLDSSDFAIPDLDCTQIGAALAMTESIGFLQSSSVDIYDATKITDPAYVLKETTQTSRAMVLYHAAADNDEAAAAAYAGRIHGYDVSGRLTTAANKRLSGITAQDLNAAQYAALVAKNANVFQKITERATNLGGRTRDGYMAANLTWKQRIGVDYFGSRIRTLVWNLLDEVSNAGYDIVFDESGMKMIAGQYRQAAQEMLGIGLVSSLPTVIVPSVDDMDSADIAAGLAKGFELSGTVADSVIYAELNAYLTRAGG